jgi:Cytochrome b(C-terminal)/b6/petD
MLGNWHQLWEIVSAPDNVPIVALLFLIPFYIWYSFRQAFANDELITKLEADPAAAKTAHRKTQPMNPKWEREVHTWPYLMRVEFVAAILVTALLMVWSLTLNAPLEEPSNPNVTMNPAKAPWYFLGLQEMLVYYDPWMAGVVMPSLIIVGLMAIPYIDANPLGNGYYTYKQRKFAIWTFCIGFIGLWVVMIMIGTFIRGPGWMWFWPTQTWDAQAVQFAVNRNLDQVFDINGAWIAHVMPAANRDYAPILARMIFGIFPVGLYFIVASYGVYRVMNATAFSRKIFKRMTLLQIVTTDIFLVLMFALPVKILARLLFRIKYIWVTPWFSI